MNGRVDEHQRPLLTLRIRASETSEYSQVTAWIDTAFDGELVMSQAAIDELQLTQTAAVRATLADGSEVLLESFECYVEWFGELRKVEAIANQGWIPLLGTGMLHDRRLTIDFKLRDLALE